MLSLSSLALYFPQKPHFSAYYFTFLALCCNSCFIPKYQYEFYDLSDYFPFHFISYSFLFKELRTPFRMPPKYVHLSTCRILLLHIPFIIVFSKLIFIFILLSFSFSIFIVICCKYFSVSPIIYNYRKQHRHILHDIFENILNSS